MKSWLFKVTDNLRTSLWFIPSLLTIGAALLSLLTQLVDETLLGREESFAWLKMLTYAGEPEGARTILGAIAGSMITVAGTVFSITIVALSLASGQFGPRLLRNFLSDRGNQAVLGTFVATFLYCILVMRRVYGESGSSDAQVPAISVTVAICLGVLSLGVLIYFIHHIAQSMQAEHIVSSVYEELKQQAKSLFPGEIGSPPEQPFDSKELILLEANLEREAQQIASQAEGYIQGIDADGLLVLAKEFNVIMRLALRPGDFVLPGATMILVHPRLTEERFNELSGRVRECVAVDIYRTPHQNIVFGIDQIVEVAVRALSPGINDPFTAISCLNRLGAVLALLVGRPMPSPYRTCSSGKVRLVIPPVSYRALVNRSFDQIRQNSRTIPAVTICLTEVLARIGERESAARRGILSRQLEAISEQLGAIVSECDREDLRVRIARARKALETNVADHHQVSAEAVSRHQRRMEQLRHEQSE